MKVLIFEGPDEVGKTTIIKTLFNRMTFGKDTDFGTRFTPIKLTHPFTIDSRKSSKTCQALYKYRLKTELNNIMSMSNDFDDSFILLVDRLHISELVYGELLRNGDFDSSMLSLADKWLAKHGSCLITVLPDSIGSNLKHFGKSGLIDGLTYDQYRDTCKKFDELHDWSEIQNKMRVHTSSLSDAISSHLIVGLIDNEVHYAEL